MKCVTPMVRFYQELPDEIMQLNPEAKPKQSIIPRSEVFKNLTKNENYLSRIQNLNKKFKSEGIWWRYELIPCGHCWACKLNYSAEWATKLTFEAERYEHKYFITLTYNNENIHIPLSMDYTDKDGHKYTFYNDGTWNGTLVPEHMTKFMKTLRKHFERQGIKDIKMFYAGEYGQLNQRPHYHLILFGAPLDITQFYDFHEDNNKKMHWKSKQIEKWWGKGLIDVAEVEWSSCAYVARYCMKKINQDNDPLEYAKLGKHKEYVRMSRRPGIGTRYFNEHQEEIYEHDEIIQKTIKGKTSSFKPPKSWDRKFKETHPEQWEAIKKSRKEAAERARIIQKEMYQGITDLEQLNRNAQKVTIKGKMLPRLAEF